MADEVAAGFVVTGRVQGVGFRWSARREAERHGVGGTIRNRADGSVEVHVRGPSHSVEGMRTWLQTGPPGARVESVRAIEPDPAAPRDHFRILR